jgi:hypothetical protein
MSIRQRVQRFFNSPRLTKWDLVLCGGAICANFYHQAFCRPVLWATIVLVIAFVPVIIYPQFCGRLQRWRSQVHFLFGIAACVCLYCILFLGWMPMYIPLLIFMKPLAIFSLLPYFLLVQIIYTARSTPGSVKPFASGVLLCIAFSAGMATWFHQSFDRVSAALNDPGKASLVPRNYMTELMLGMHVKYHISFCAYDGWRPPLHDPSIVVAAWLNVPFHASSYFRRTHYDAVCPAPIFFGGDRMAVYASVFPNRSLWQSCSCAIEGAESYYLDAEHRNWRQYEYARTLRQ